MGYSRFSSRVLPEAERAAAIQDEYAAVAGIEVDRLDDAPLAVDVAVRTLPGLTVAAAACLPCVARRTPAHVADGNDDFVLCIPTAGRFLRRGPAPADLVCRPGEAYLGPNDVPGERRFPDSASFLDIVVPRAALVPHLLHLDRALRRPLAPSAELQLLAGYARALVRDAAELSAQAAAVASAHVRDLALLVLGAARDAAHLARRRGLRDARLRAVRADVLANLTHPGLSVAMMAARHRISVQYLRALFNSAGTTFADFVREQRLERARRLLQSPQHATRRISDIAFESGFGDLSYFNRTFRRRYGMTPSDVRALAPAPERPSPPAPPASTHGPADGDFEPDAVK